MIKTYMVTADITEIYYQIKGSSKGLENFKKDAKNIAKRTRKGAFVYTDELALYKIFEKHLKPELDSHGIDCFGRLMQYIS